MDKQDIVNKLNNLDREIAKIKNRNKKVELDKTWEISWTRKICIAIFTYIVIGLFMASISVTKPWLNAIIPTMGFILSTMSLPFIKNVWLKTKK